MNQSIPLLRVITGLLLLFVVVILVPLVALATFNHPSPTDDYCFTNTVLNYGFWQAQQFYYDGWTGRYFHNFIVHTNPLVIGWYGGYKIYPIVFLALILLGFYALANQWLHRSFGVMGKLALTSGLFVGFMVTLPGLPEYLYWYTGWASYGLSSVLFLLLLATLMAHQRRGFGVQPGYLLIESLLVTAIIGSSEMTMVLVLSVLGLILLGELIQRRRVSVTTVVLLVVSAVSCYYLFKAPGNAIRMGGNPHSSDLKLTITSSLRFAAVYFVQQALRTPWLPLSVLYLPMAWQLVNRRVPPYLRLHPLLGLAYGVATVLALISLHFYGVGIPPIPRLINIVNLTFWLCWLYVLTLGLAFFRDRIHPERLLPHLRPEAILLLVWAAVAAAFGPVLPLAYGDWLSGRAAAYDRAMQNRYALLARPNSPVTLLDPLPNYPASLFLEDIHTDPNHLWNRCWADYFDKKTVILSGDANPSTR